MRKRIDTGLKDCNGTPIYTGDSIKARYATIFFGRDKAPFAVGVVVLKDGVVSLSVNYSKHEGDEKAIDPQKAIYPLKHNFIDRDYELEVIHDGVTK